MKLTMNCYDANEKNIKLSLSNLYLSSFQAFVVGRSMLFLSLQIIGNEINFNWRAGSTKH